MRALRGGAIAIALWAVATVASAAPCAGFEDVADTDLFCPNVQWLKNRGITLGCDTTLYCPNAAVTRLQMAAFMNRLGTALTPRQATASAGGFGPYDLDQEQIFCPTTVPPVGYPQRAFIDATVSAMAPAEVTYAIEIVMTPSTYPPPWVSLNANPVRASVASGEWGAASAITQVDLEAGWVGQLAIRLTRGGVASTTNLAEVTCDLRAILHSRDGATAPY